MSTRSLATRLSAKTLSQEAFNKFRANRQWLQDAVSGFSPANANGSPVKPCVLLYGSAVSGTAFKDGDADFAVVFAKQHTEGDVTPPTETSSPVAEIKREEQESILAKLFQHVGDHTKSETLKPQRIFRARIPIVQYLRRTSAEEALKFDVSLSLDGVKNSLLLRQYMVQYPRLHLGVMCVKQWGREAKILNARRGWISPYALTILYIHFMASTKRIPDLIDEGMIVEKVHKIFHEMSEDPSHLDSVPELNSVVEIGDADLEEVKKDVYEFFCYYGDSSQFDFDSTVVDIRKHERVRTKEQWLAMVSELPPVDRWHLLGHEVVLMRDPYESHNLGRSVDFFRGEAIREVFRLASTKKSPLSFLSC